MKFARNNFVKSLVLLLSCAAALALAACGGDDKEASISGVWVLDKDESKKNPPFKDNKMADQALASLDGMNVEIDMDKKSIRVKVLGQEAVNPFEIKSQDKGKYVLINNGQEVTFTQKGSKQLEMSASGMTLTLKRG